MYVDFDTCIDISIHADFIIIPRVYINVYDCVCIAIYIHIDNDIDIHSDNDSDNDSDIDIDVNLIMDMHMHSVYISCRSSFM